MPTTHLAPPLLPFAPRGFRATRKLLWPRGRNQAATVGSYRQPTVTSNPIWLRDERSAKGGCTLPAPGAQAEGLLTDGRSNVRHITVITVHQSHHP